MTAAPTAPPRVEARFRLQGRFDPGVVGERTGVVATRRWRAGDPRVPTALVRHELDGWEVMLGPRRSWDAGELVSELVAMLHPHSPALVAVVNEFALDPMLVCVVFLFEEAQAPAMCFGRDVTKWAATIGASIDVDVWANREATPEEDPRVATGDPTPRRGRDG